MGKKSFTVKLKLRLAKDKDFLQLKGYKDNGKKIFKFRHGVPYWMLNSKGEIENKHYITSDATDMQEFRDYMNRKQILVPK